MIRRFAAWLLVVPSIWGCDHAPLSLPGRKGNDSSRPELSTAAAAAGTGAVQVFFTDPGGSRDDPRNPARVLAGLIDRAAKSIDVCAFELDNQQITDALLRAVRRGVRVRLVTETSYLNESGTQALKQAGVPVVDDRRDSALMHNKFMVFDNKSVWTGSMNFTENCAYRNNNHGVYVDDERIAANYATKFSWMFDQRQFGSAPSRTAKIPYPAVTLRDGTPIENYFSAHDRVAAHVTAVVNQARLSVHFLAFSFTHDGIGNAMLQRASAGATVQGVFERTQAAGTYTEYPRFRSAGQRVQVYLDANPRNMHHKVIIVDGECTVAGSFNFSEGADKQNDENILIFKSRSIAQQFETEFQKLFAAAQKADAPATLVSGKR